MMAVRKATRSTPPAQLKPKLPDHQLKAEIFEALRHLNRGYGVALSALDRLEVKDRQRGPRAFPTGFLHDYRNSAETLRARTNRDLLRLLAGHEDHDLARFSRPAASPAARRSRV